MMRFSFVWWGLVDGFVGVLGGARGQVVFQGTGKSLFNSSIPCFQVVIYKLFLLKGAVTLKCGNVLLQCFQNIILRKC